jgi:hypothetical protein
MSPPPPVDPDALAFALEPPAPLAPLPLVAACDPDSPLGSLDPPHAPSAIDATHQALVLQLVPLIPMPSPGSNWPSREWLAADRPTDRSR